MAERLRERGCDPGDQGVFNALGLLELPGRLKSMFVTFLSFLLLATSTFANTSYSIETDNGLSLEFSSDGQIERASIDGYPLHVAGGPVLWIRDMSSSGEIQVPNLLSNPGFESALSSWNVWPGSEDTTIGVTSNSKRTGHFSLQMYSSKKSGLGLGAVYSDAIRVVQGSKYRISGYFLSSRGFLQGISGTPPIRQDSMWRGGARPNGIYVLWLDERQRYLADEGLTLVAPVHWNAHNWRKVGGEVRVPPDASYMVIVVMGRLMDEYLWVDDLTVVKSPEHEKAITGQMVQQGNTLVQTASMNGLMVTATYSATSGYLDVNIELQDTTGRERALEVIWGIPVNLTYSGTWRWWDDVHHSRNIVATDPAPPPQCPFPKGLSWTYEHVVSGVWDGWLPVSLYPYSVIENGTVGLGMATSLDSPQLAKLAYDQTKGRYEIRGYVGISPGAKRLNGKATLSFMIFKTDPRWGFRSLMDLVAQRYPSWFNTGRAGYSFNGYERGSYGNPDGARKVAEYDQNGIFVAEYIVGDAPVTISSTSAPFPDYAQAVEAISTLAVPQQQAITQSIAHSPNGDWELKHVGEFEWARGVWQGVWYTSTDPDIEDGWGQFLWNQLIEPAIDSTMEAGAVLDGVLMDNFMTVPGIDVRPEHTALQDTALAYDITTYRPGVHNAANMKEFFSWLRERLNEKGRDDMSIAVNFWGIATPNGLIQWIDVFGGEGNSKDSPTVNWNTRILDYRRAIAFHKPMTFSNAAKDLPLSDVKEFVDLALFYGIFPKRKEEATGWAAGSDKIVEDAVDLLHRYGYLGWEPVTLARTENENLWVERFGSFNSLCDKIVFAVYNTANATISSSLRVDLSGLGFESPYHLKVTNLKTSTPVGHRIEGDSLIIPLGLEAGKTALLEIRLDNYRPQTGGPVVTINPPSRNFSVDTQTPFTFEFTIEHPHLMTDIADFKFIFCGIDITEPFLEGVAPYLTNMEDTRLRVEIPDVLFPPGFWTIEIVTEDIQGRTGCDEVSYNVRSNGCRYPRLGATIFSPIPHTQDAAEALSVYGAVQIPDLFSYGDRGGCDLGERRGMGSWQDTFYDFGDGNGPQETVYQAKHLNRDLIVLSDRGLSKIETAHFNYSTNCPQRWFLDNLSPKWFAYTPLIKLQEAVTEPSQLVFKFSPEDIAPWRRWGIRGGKEQGLTIWTKGNQYDWYYLSFFDNEAGGGRGTVELMAIYDIDWDTGSVTVAVRDAGNGHYKRNIFGRPQRYPAGSRAGIVPNSSPSAGAPNFLMNRYCADTSYPECQEMKADGTDWLGVSADYVKDFLMASRYPSDSINSLWLVDGLMMDADCEVWQPYNFPLSFGHEYHLDQDLDGVVDDIDALNERLPLVYAAYAKRVKDYASEMGRDFYVVTNGAFSGFPVSHHNGREFEDFNGGFQDSYLGALEQYMNMFIPGMMTEAPVIAIVAERDETLQHAQNFDEHRHIMALTLMLDGFYDHTGYATRIRALGYSGNEAEDWFDEFSVDPYGYSSKHPLYSGTSRGEYTRWLGRALGSFYQVEGTGVYRRDFEHGTALYSLTGGRVELDPPLRRICGKDPGNDGSIVSELTMTPRSGIILRRDEKSGKCPD